MFTKFASDRGTALSLAANCYSPSSRCIDRRPSYNPGETPRICLFAKFRRITSQRCPPWSRDSPRTVCNFGRRCVTLRIRAASALLGDPARERPSARARCIAFLFRQAAADTGADSFRSIFYRYFEIQGGPPPLSSPFRNSTRWTQPCVFEILMLAPTRHTPPFVPVRLPRQTSSSLFYLKSCFSHINETTPEVLIENTCYFILVI